VILLIVLVAFSSTNCFDFNSSEINALKSSSYGASLIETISLTLQNKGSVADIQQLLIDLLYKLGVDQEKADNDWKKEKKELEDKIKELREQIENLDIEIGKKKGEKVENENKRKTADENLLQYDTQKKANDKSIIDLEEHRKKDFEEFQKSTTDHSTVVNAIDLVVQELTKLTGSISGNAKPAHVDELQHETRDREFKKLTTSFVQITKDETEALIFAQMATSADQEALQKLIGLLRSLAESVKASQIKDSDHEEESKNSYNKLKGQLTSDNTNLEKMIKDQGENRKTYDDNVIKLGGEIEALEKLRNSKNEEKIATEKELSNKENQYNKDKAERDNESKIIKRLQTIVEQRLANVSKFLKDTTGAF